jgi:hypothetical protein
MRRLLLLGLVGAILLNFTPVLADDDFYVVVAGGNVGTKIISVPYTISTSGFYYLGKNLTYSGSSNAITITTSQVTLDLMGFSLTGPGSLAERGISINGDNVEVRNGSVIKFDNAIHAAGQSLRLANLKVSNCYSGIYLNSGFGSIVTNCQSVNNSYGISVNGSGVIIDKNIVRNNTSSGFSSLVSGIISNNVATSNGIGFRLGGIPAQLVHHNCSYANVTNWDGLTGCTQELNTP